MHPKGNAYFAVQRQNQNLLNIQISPSCKMTFSWPSLLIATFISHLHPWTISKELGKPFVSTHLIMSQSNCFTGHPSVVADCEINRKRRRVLKNNERISNAAKASLPPPEDIQDQGFTRPSVLLLLPFRSSALAWFSALATHTPKPQFQIENHARFLAEYGLPEGVTDKLAQAEEGAWPSDHVEMFRGNCDDSFRLGIKFTRKSVKLFAEFYGCDIIIASPLGLRMSIEKEKYVKPTSSCPYAVFADFSFQKRRLFIFNRGPGS